MPTSDLACWPVILHHCWEYRQQHTGGTWRVCDVGPGRGKAAILLREYVDPAASTEAVESELRYITSFALGHLYDRVHAHPAQDHDYAGYDLVLMVDVIEHLSDQDALAVLDRVWCPVVVCTPGRWFQNPEAEQWPSERHRSLWSCEALAALGFTAYRHCESIIAHRGQHP